MRDEQQEPCLGEAVEHRADLGGVQADADGRVQRVRRQHVLVHALGAAHLCRGMHPGLHTLDVHEARMHAEPTCTQH